MKKLLAALLALAMLLGACACAEGVRVSLKDIVLYQGGEVSADLRGFELNAVVATIGPEDTAMRLECIANDQTVMNITLGETDQKLVIGYGNSEGFTKSYLLPIQASQTGLHEEVAALDLIGQGDWTLTEFLRGVLPAQYLTDAGVTRYEGQDCETTQIALDEAEMDKLIQAFSAIADAQNDAQQQLAAAGFESYSQVIDQLDLRMSMSGGMYECADWDALDVTLNLTVLNSTMQVRACVRHHNAADGHQFDLTIDASEAGEAFTVTALAEAVEEASSPAWMPLETSGAEVLDPATLDVDAFMAEFRTEIESVIGFITTGAMSVMYNNKLASAQ